MDALTMIPVVLFVAAGAAVIGYSVGKEAGADRSVAEIIGEIQATGIFAFTDGPLSYRAVIERIEVKGDSWTPCNPWKPLP